MASERRADESEFSFDPHKYWRKLPKAGWKLEELFKICDSIRKELQDEELI